MLSWQISKSPSSAPAYGNPYGYAQTPAAIPYGNYMDHDQWLHYDDKVYHISFGFRPKLV